MKGGNGTRCYALTILKNTLSPIPTAPGLKREIALGLQLEETQHPAQTQRKNNDPDQDHERTIWNQPGQVRGERSRDHTPDDEPGYHRPQRKPNGEHEGC
jgi:hypothetical protein